MTDAIVPLIAGALLCALVLVALRRAWTDTTGVVVETPGLSTGPALGFDQEALEQYGVIWADLLCEGASWILRRKEALTLQDVDTFRRRMSIDYTVPAALQAKGIPQDAEGRVFVPVMCLEKAQANLTRFDFGDERRSSLPLPTRQENGMISAYVLIAAAERALGEPASATLRRDLVGLAVAEPPVAEAYLSRVVGDDALSPRERRHRSGLAKNREFLWLADTLAYSCVVVVPVEPTPARHILKLSFDQRVDDDKRLRWLARAPFGQSFGWNPLEIIIDSPFIAAQSYHFEAEVAPSIEILEAYLMTSFKDDFVELNRVVAGSSSVHVYVSEAETGQASVAQVTFRVERGTFLLGAFIASALVLLSLGLSVGFVDYIAAHHNGYAGLLAAFPSAVVAYVLRGTGHDLATRLVWKARTVLLVVGLLPLLAGGRLAADGATASYHPDPDGLLQWWIPLLIAAGLGTLMLFWAVVFPRAPRRIVRLNDRFGLNAPTD